MMRNLVFLFILIILITRTSFAQPDSAWTARLSLDRNVELYDAIEHSNGDFFLCGEIQMENSYLDAFLVRMNGVGDTVWTRNSAIPNQYERAYALTEISNGNIVYCGTASGSNMLMSCYSPNGEFVWNRTLSIGTNTEGHDLVGIPGGGYAVAVRRGTGITRDYCLVVCNNNGDTLWTRTHGTVFTDLAAGIELLPGGGFAIAGTTHQGGSNYDVALLRTDAQGNQLSLDFYGTEATEECLAFDLDENGDFLFGGYQYQSGFRAYVAKVIPAGDLSWQEDFRVENLPTQVRGVAPFLEGGVICAGYVGSSTASVFWMGTLGNDGNLIDSWVWGTAISAFQQIIRVSDGGYIAVGHWDAGPINDGYVFRIVPPSGLTGIVTDVETGDLLAGVRISTLESQLYTVTDSLGRYSISAAAGIHNVVASGVCFDTDTVFNVVVEELQTVEVDLEVGVPHLVQNQTSINIIARNQVLSTGLLSIENTGSGRLHYRTMIVNQDPPGNWLTVNPAEGWIPAHESFDAIVEVLADTTNDAVYEFFATIHVSTNSCPDSTFDLPVIATVLDADKPNAVISEFALHSAYPNPFNASTRITFDLPVDSEINLQLFNIEGKLSANLVEGRYSVGRHDVMVNGSNLASGLYIARLTAGSFTANQKLILLK